MYVKNKIIQIRGLFSFALIKMSFHISYLSHINKQLSVFVNKCKLNFSSKSQFYTKYILYIFNERKFLP